MKLSLVTMAACLLLLAVCSGSTPTPGQELRNITAPTEASASVVERILALQDHVKQWANQLSKRTRSAFQKLQVQEVNRVMSTWFTDFGKRIGGFGKKAQ